jgi:two-component system sensor histidine kinase KdpD
VRRPLLTTRNLTDSSAAEASRRGRLSRLGLLVLSIALATAISVAASETRHPVTAANAFIVAVLINGSVGGLALGVVSAVLVSAIYLFFIRFPVYAFGIDAIDDLTPVFALTITALVSGAVSGQLRSRVAATERARQGLTRLLAFSQQLHRAVSREEIARQLITAIPHEDQREHCLKRVNASYEFRDAERWQNAVELERSSVDTSALSFEPQADLDAADRQAIAGLTVMAIERIELLEEFAHAEAAIRSDKLKSALISSLSHDLRTPLAAIATSATNLDQLGSTLREGERSQMISTIQQQTQRLVDFTTKLMSLGRLEGGLTGADMDVVELEDAVDGALASVRAGGGQHRIDRRIEAETMFVRASPLLLEQALANLVENALRYSPPETRVVVRLGRQDDWGVIAICDDGPGIRAEDLPHVFERFFRGGNSAGRPGHGLGLSIVKAFTDAMDGTLEILSPLGANGGTEVRLKLPILDIVLDPEDPELG